MQSRCWPLLIFVVGAAAGWGAEPWVSMDSLGHLQYRMTKRGDRILDFSYAGYMSGGMPLPKVPIVETVTPSDGDDTALIQAAIDRVSTRPLKDGVRGAVKLATGTFHCSGTLNINSSGVVLRGSGFDANGTTIEMTGKPHVAVTIAGNEKVEAKSPTVHIAQDYVPSGTRSITLDNASSVHEGDTIRIVRVTTPQWLRFMGMDKLWRDGKPEVWSGTRLLPTGK